MDTSLPADGRAIWSLLDASERRRALLLAGLMLVGMILEMLGVGLILPVLAMITQPDLVGDLPFGAGLLDGLGARAPESVAVLALGALVAVYGFKSLFLGLLAWAQMRFAFSVQANLSHRLFDIYLRQDYAYHLQRNSAELVRNTINDVTIFTQSGLVPGITLVTELLVVAGVAALLLFVEPVGAILVVAVIGFAGMAFHLLTRRQVVRWGEQRLVHDALRIQHLQQGLASVKEIKVLGREAEFIGRFRHHNVACATALQHQSTVQQLPRLWVEFLAVAGLALLVVVLVGQGRRFADILPTIGLFAAAAFRMMPSVNRIIAAAQNVKYALPVVRSLSLEVAALPAPVVMRDAAAMRFGSELRLRDVGYAYPGTTARALDGINVEVRRGSAVGFIGHSGAGKSTLVDLLLGLLTPQAGAIEVDGTDIARDVRAWQRQVGYVPQTINLTDDSLRRNIAFGVPDSEIDEHRLQVALRAAQLETFVDGLPEGLETRVGERGVRLSGGQRQRIGIARALYHDPAVLVLDEATSSLDTETETAVMAAVEALHGTKTLIVIAHRVSTLKGCDHVYRLERGRVVAQGTTEEMLSDATGAA